MEKIFVHKPTGSTLYIKGTKWNRTFTLDSRWPKAEEVMVYLMCKAFGFGIEVERAMWNKNLDRALECVDDSLFQKEEVSDDNS